MTPVSARLRNDLGLVLTWTRLGAARAALTVLCTALVSALLLVVVTVLLLGWERQPAELLATTVAEPGLRGGYAFAVLLVCLAPLTLLRQAVRLGTADREQRLAALRLAGATPADVRRWGALEVALPALAGSLLGYPAFLVLRSVVGGRLRPTSAAGYDDPVTRELLLVPVSVEPAWWHTLAVVVLVTALGGVAGAAAARAATVSPLGASRRAPRRAPRPWGAALLLLAGAALALSFAGSSSSLSMVFGIATVGLLLLAMLSLTPWVAYRVGRGVAARATRPHVLLAARRLATDPRPAGRAAAAVGAIGMVAGAAGALASDLPATAGGQGFGAVEPMYTVPVALVAGVLLVAMGLVVVTLTVHGVETLVDRRRAVASLAAAGATLDDLLRAQRWEVGLVAVPVTVLGVLIGSVPYLVMADWLGRYAWIPVLVDVVTVGVAWLVVLASTRLTRRWLVGVASPENLRTA